MMLDFVIAGFPKCGSFSAYNVLNQHSGVVMSERKEPSLFDHNFDRFDEFFRREFPYSDYTGQLLGEATVEYAVKEHCLQRLSEHNPKMKVILMVRDPIERAYSHYWHRKKMGIEVGEFSDLIRAEKTSFPIEYSLYYKHISKVLEYFPENQVHVIGVEDLKNDFQSEVDMLLDFLNLAKEPLVFRQDNQSKIYKSKRAAKAFRFVRRLKLRGEMNQKLYDSLHAGYKKIKDKNLKPLQKPTILPQDHRYLESVFKQDVSMLKGLLNRNLSLFEKYP